MKTITPPEALCTWVDGYRSKLPAKVAGPALLKLAGDRGLEGLPAAEIVEAASHPASPLHAGFEWDNTEAARQYRLEQARAMARSIRIVVTLVGGAPKEVRLFVNLNDNAGYRSTVAVQKDSDSRERLVMLALGEVRSARARLANIRGYGAIVKKLAKIEAEILAEAKAAAKAA